MNIISVASVQTLYDYEETYWMIDGKPIVQYIDEYRKQGKCEQLNKFGSMLGLLPAWTGMLEWRADNSFIWEMIYANESLNVPILVCEDDCDLSCIVIIAKIRKTNDRVYWDKIGLLNHENENIYDEIHSGILCLESYTQEDWEKYGDNVALETSCSEIFKSWVSENWDEELIRRRRNYTKPYMQKDENIYWIEDTNWEFDCKEYQKVISVYRNIYIANMGD